MTELASSCSSSCGPLPPSSNIHNASLMYSMCSFLPFSDKNELRHCFMRSTHFVVGLCLALVVPSCHEPNSNMYNDSLMEYIHRLNLLLIDFNARLLPVSLLVRFSSRISRCFLRLTSSSTSSSSPCSSFVLLPINVRLLV